MAVVAVVGGAVIGAVVYDNHSDYSDYSNYDNYSNYSDAAERRQRRMEEKKREIEQQKYEINTYKVNSVNGYLQSSSLQQQKGVDVPLAEVKLDGDLKISNEETRQIAEESVTLNADIQMIDKVIAKIDKILKENE